MPLKGIIEQLVSDEFINPSTDLGNHISNEVFAFEGQELPQGLIDEINNHPPFNDYAGFIRWIWKKIKEGAQWLWDKLFGDEED
jgi:hypothetical protein